MFCDNKSTICLTKNPEFHSRSKHIDIRYHFIKDKIKENKIKIEWQSKVPAQSAHRSIRLTLVILIQLNI